MRRIRWQLIIAFGGLVLLLGYLLGQSPIEESLTPEPIAGGIYREGLIGMVSRLNPLLDSNNQVDEDIDRLLYRGLVQFDSRGIPQPDLAESWAVSADATLYTFRLRDDATWHDGEPVVSDDVIYTYSKFQE
jgi:peptide/nickel transport system substrate-binding protein